MVRLWITAILIIMITVGLIFPGDVKSIGGSLIYFVVMCSMKEYEEKAVTLALNRPKLQALTNKLKAVRMTCPLFDTARWVCSCELTFYVCVLG